MIVWDAVLRKLLSPVFCLLTSEMPFDLNVMLAAPFIVIAAYIIFGISGFGSALISIPLLAHVLPLKMVVPMVVLLDFSAAFFTGMRARANVNLDEAKRFVPPVLIGIAVGVFLLKGLPGQPLLYALGGFVAGYGAFALLRKSPLPASPAWLAYPVGVFGGLIAALFGVGGPVYATYLATRIAEPSALRATLSVVFSFSTATRIVMFLVSGLLLDSTLWLGALLLIPFMFVGMYIGRHIHLQWPKERLVRFVNALLIASGISLIARAAGWH